MEHAVYRIIDANFNRAREALRVMEEYCRFVLNNELLTGRVKQLRHRFSGCIGQLNAWKLVISRDTIGDVGVGQKVEGQLNRMDLQSSFTAACKRVTEAFRAISEVVQTVQPAIAAEVEKFRYEAYTLEKEIIEFGEPAAKFKRVRLYVIVSGFPADVISLTCKCIDGKADCIQLRMKDVSDDVLFAVAKEFVGLCRMGGVLSIINNRMDIAAATGADGVHLGRNDLPIEQARKLQLSPMIMGLSTHSKDELIDACTHNPTYVSIGPVFATKTKPEYAIAGLGYVKEAAEILQQKGIAGVAIGGITRDNVAEVLKSGAERIALCSAVADAADAIKECKELKEKITNLIKD